MARIRVDTADLKTKARDFESAADTFNKAGDEIAAAAMAMPSYDGQLSGPARRAGYEIQNQAKEVAVGLSADAQSLKKTAQAFEAVDNEAVETLNEYQGALVGHNSAAKFLYFPTAKANGGNEVIGYQFISDDYVVLWYKGEYMRIHLAVPPLSSADYMKTMDFIGFVDSFDADKKAMRDDVIKVWDLGGGGLILMIVAAVKTGGIGAIAVGISAFLEQLGYAGDELLKFIDRLKRFNDARTALKDLSTSGDPGIEVVHNGP
jgi:hypothetical protein